MNRLTTVAAACTLALTTLLATTVATAHDYTQGDIIVDHPWSRPTPPGTPMGVGYMAITNNGDQDVTLKSATTPRAKAVSIHQSMMHGDMMRMQPLKDGLTIPAGETVEFKPHSYHLMLEKLTAPLKEGERVPLTLSFEGAESMEVELAVEPMDGGGHH